MSLVSPCDRSSKGRGNMLALEDGRNVVSTGMVLDLVLDLLDG
jgi:hypothetical protein